MSDGWAAGGVDIIAITYQLCHVDEATKSLPSECPPLCGNGLHRADLGSEGDSEPFDIVKG